jgi:alpha-ketoglutarate-dependent taurine dioxygenase
MPADLYPSKTETQISKTPNMSRLLAVEGNFLFPFSNKSSLINLRNIRAHKHFGSEFHSDHSYELNPPSYTLLRMVKTPPSGGDTIFTSQAALFDKLSPTFQKTFEGLHAIHTSDVSICSMLSTT